MTEEYEEGYREYDEAWMQEIVEECLRLLSLKDTGTPIRGVVVEVLSQHQGFIDPNLVSELEERVNRRAG
jgi:hypothetical protein